MLGAGLWDALWKQSPDTYSADVAKLSTALKSLRAHSTSTIHTVGNSLAPSEPMQLTHKARPVFVWLQPTTIFDKRLATPEKLEHMNEKHVKAYRDAAKTGLACPEAVDFVLDTSAASSGRSEATMDGIHYVDEVYKVVTQMLANAYAFKYPAALTEKTLPALTASSGNPPGYVPKASGSMSFPTYGLFVLALSAVMMFGMDNFLGLGFLSLSLFGRRVRSSYSLSLIYLSFSHTYMYIKPLPPDPPTHTYTHTHTFTDGLGGRLRPTAQEARSVCCRY